MDKIIKGTVEINVERKTVTLHLENGSYCIDHYTHGIKRFLDDEIDCLSDINKVVKGWDLVD